MVQRKRVVLMTQIAQLRPKARSVIDVEEFLGIDYTSNADNVGPKMSPYAPNMIRDVPGKVRKSMGWYVEKTYSGAINGRHARRGDTQALIHAGTNIYRGDTVLYSAANNAPSHSWQFGDKLYIIDGASMLMYDGTTVTPVNGTNAYIPKLYISENPTGGGTEYEELNLLSPYWIETYAGTASDTAYHLTFSGLDTDYTPQVWTLNSSGDWVSVTNFTVDYSGGIINFTAAPGVSPVTGEDNVKIQAKRTVSGYADRVNKCTVGVQFGVNANPDRLFLAGNPSLTYLNWDWHSGQNDPTYFPDTGYSEVGNHASAIMGYAIVSNYLATFKDEHETDRNVIVREGNLVDSKPAFPIVNTMQGPGACAKNSFAYLGNEPLFLTRSGVIAITTSDISGERYSHTRSYYINTALMDEIAAQEAADSDFSQVCALSHDDFYWLFLNGKIWLLDDRQWQYPTYTSSSGTTAYSNRQLSCFNRLNVPAVCAWVDKNVCFGTADGRVCRFFTDKEALTSYSDGGVMNDSVLTTGTEIYSCWETPDLNGHYFYKNKKFKYLALRLSPAVATSVSIYGMKKGLLTFLKSISNKARYFSYAHLVYSKLTYSNDQSSRTLHTQINIQKMDKGRFRFENGELNEPFGLLSYAIEYTESGNYRG